MNGYPECPRCSHGWHGLACTKTVPALNLSRPVGATVCGCPSPYDDDYWKDGVQ